MLSPWTDAQQATLWPPPGISCDAGSDLLDVAVDNMDRLIYHPAELFVEEAGEGVISRLEIVR